jgi:hypothetical protein
MRMGIVLVLVLCCLLLRFETGPWPMTRGAGWREHRYLLTVERR